VSKLHDKTKETERSRHVQAAERTAQARRWPALQAEKEPVKLRPEKELRGR
jgi:hypothetical protein